MTHTEVKIAVIGGASSYTPELIDGLIRHRARIPVANLTLMDIYAERLKIIGGMAQRMLDHAGYPLEITLTNNRAEALEGADFVICQIRVGGMSARLLDEAVPPRYGVVGQETVGPGGIASALRTIPVMLEIAEDVQKICPDTWFLNFTNPSGLITETLLNHTSVNAIGLCNIPTDMHLGIARICEEKFEDVTLDYIGINHLSWIRDVFVCGGSRMDGVLNAYIQLMSQDANPLFDDGLLETLGMIPSYYLAFYYNHPRMLTEQLHGLQSRAERVMDIEQQLLRLYADPKTVEKPALLTERGGTHYSLVAIQLIAAIIENSGETQILNVANGGTFTNLAPEAVIEVPCRVDARGAHPLPAAPIPLHVRGLLETVKASEQLTIEAAIMGDQRIALRALMTNPLVPSFTVARSLLAALLAENVDYLPQFALYTVGR
jgi:6-phospho-beta-glucosidase